MIVDFFLYGNELLKVLVVLGAFALYTAIIVFEAKWGDEDDG